MGIRIRKPFTSIFRHILAISSSATILWLSRVLISPFIGSAIIDIVPRNWLSYATIQSRGGYILAFLTLFWPLLFFLPMSLFVELRFRLFLRFPLFAQSIALGIFYFSLCMLISTLLWPFLLDNALRSLDISIAAIGHWLVLRLLAEDFASEGSDNIQSPFI